MEASLHRRVRGAMYMRCEVVNLVLLVVPRGLLSTQEALASWGVLQHLTGCSSKAITKVRHSGIVLRSKGMLCCRRSCSLKHPGQLLRFVLRQVDLMDIVWL
ncbi:hypothetical protein MRX96_010450 [Rhipicephalus microplus]